MSNKTEYAGTYYEDDFVQVGEQLNELTVTITLCEYRQLVRDQIRQALFIEKLHEEKSELEKEKEELEGKNKILAEMILSGHKDEIGEIGELAMKIMGIGEDNDEGEEET